MPFQTYTIQKGSTRRSVLAYAVAKDGAPASGLAVDISEVTAAYVRDDGTTGRIEVVLGSPGGWTPGGFAEVDPAVAPGMYQLDLPDEVLASGAKRAAVVVRAAGATFEPFDIDLVAFDPQDVDRIGMEALAFEQRIKCLTTAFPRLAVEEQKRLADQSREAGN